MVDCLFIPLTIVGGLAVIFAASWIVTRFRIDEKE